MPIINEIVFNFAIEGVNDSVSPGILGKNGVARMTNCRIHKQFPTTRHGVMVHPLGGDAIDFRSQNIQGATFYNPTLGQSQQSFGADQASIVVAAGGKKFHLTFGVNDIVSVSDETNGHQGVPDNHLAWLFQAENYVICQDGAADTWIWDGRSGAFVSDGYDSEAPEESELANAATCGAYAHGRIVQVVDGKKIFVGDILHKSRLSDPSNILRTTEQVYFATGSFFSPPSNMGEVVAIALLPLRNTQHGHDDVLVHCKYGVFSLKLDHYPRSQWSEVAISKHLLLDTAACGPYSIILYDGDQMFRSRYGVQTIRSAAANADTIGSAQQAISEPVRSLMEADYTPYLRFSSMAKWMQQHRAFCTTGMWMSGSHRGGRGITSLNMNPQGAYASNVRAWEGLWTFPYGVSRPVQMINGLFGDRDKLLMLATEEVDEGIFNNSLVEIVPHQHFDRLENGTTQKISCQVISRMLPGEDLVSYKTIHNGRIVFGDVVGSLEWGVWVRASETDGWTLWTTHKWCAPEECETADCLLEPKHHRLILNLGDPPNAFKQVTQLQVLVRFRGYAQLECVRVGIELSDNDDRTVPDCPEGSMQYELADCCFNDYEYSEKEPSWTV